MAEFCLTTTGDEVNPITRNIAMTSDSSLFGRDWKLISALTGGILCIEYGGGSYAMVGSDGGSKSIDNGVTWSALPWPSGGSNSYSIIYGNGTWILLLSAGNVAIGQDLSTWVTKTTGYGYRLTSGVYGGGVFVLVGSNYSSTNILRSTDGGSTWVARYSGSSAGFICAAYGAGVFVVAGPSGSIYTSSDSGATWVSRTSGTTNSINRLLFADGVFVAVGDGGLILKSSDSGVTWISKSGYASQALYGATYANGMIFIVGVGKTLLVSLDLGNTFESRSLPATPSTELMSISTSSSELIICGNIGTVIKSP